MNDKTKKIIVTHLVATVIGILAAFFIVGDEEMGVGGRIIVVFAIGFINWVASLIYI